MKNLILSLSTVFCLCVLLSSCNKDVCYDCTLSLLGVSTTETFCEGDAVTDSTGTVTLTKDDVDAAVTAFEALGGSCDKQ